jgi:hypothetical protein
VTGVSEPVHERVVGVLPDGTRYELRIPSGVDIGEVEGINAVVVWAEGESAGNPIGVTRFSRQPASCGGAESVTQTSVCDGRLVVPTSSWTMVVDVHDYSGREPLLETIKARTQDGMIVLELPAAFRFPEVGELPTEMQVSYGTIRVVRGCSGAGTCSPDGRVRVVAVGSGTDTAYDEQLSGVRVRTLPPIMRPR